MKALVLFYSYGGNTRNIAELIRKSLDCDIAEIRTVTSYSNDYDTVADQGRREINDGYEPEIKPLEQDPAGYDTIILGMPVWWYTFAPAVKTILSSADWSGKAVYPFATNGGWIGHTFRDVEKACQGADVKQGINIRFNGQRLVTSQAEINKWIDQIKGGWQCHL